MYSSSDERPVGMPHEPGVGAREEDHLIEVGRRWRIAAAGYENDSVCCVFTSKIVKGQEEVVSL